MQATGFKARVDKLFKDKLCLLLLLLLLLLHTTATTTTTTTTTRDRVYKGGSGAPCKAEGDQTFEGPLPDVSLFEKASLWMA